MIPLRALLYRRNMPVMTLLIIAVNVLCFLYEISMPPEVRDYFIMRHGLVPDHALSSLHAMAGFITSMFLHAGWLHLIGNMWFLWIFGSHIEDAMGPGKFLGFYIIGGLASAFVQFVVELGSPVPTVGASGAIAAVMGAFLMLYPRVRIVTLVFIFIFITTVDIPAAFMLLYWFVIQFVSGLGWLSNISQGQGVAWFAHIGGFLAGLALVRGFQQRRTRYIY